MTTLPPLQPAIDAATRAGQPVAPAETEAEGPSKTESLTPATAANGALNETTISSPHELTDWVDNILDQLESRFTTMTAQAELRMKEMSDRIDALESSIEELTSSSIAPFSGPPRSSTRDSGSPISSKPQVRISETGTSF